MCLTFWAARLRLQPPASRLPSPLLPSSPPSLSPCPSLLQLLSPSSLLAVEELCVSPSDHPCMKNSNDVHIIIIHNLDLLIPPRSLPLTHTPPRFGVVALIIQVVLEGHIFITADSLIILTEQQK